MSKGEAELICSAYIDLNSVRAGIVNKPEDYRWSSIGLRVRNKRKADKLLEKIIIVKETVKTFRNSDTGKISQTSECKEQKILFPVYKEFVYNSGKVKRESTASITGEEYKESQSLFNRLGLGDSLKYKYRNITEGIAFGNYKLILELQEKLCRKIVKPKIVIANKDENFYSTRKLNPI